MLNINIHVHQLGAARFLLPAPPSSSRRHEQFEPSRIRPTDIHLSYHGEYHYNSLKMTEGRCNDRVSPAPSLEAVTTMPNTVIASSHHSALFEHVALSVPWASEIDIYSAMKQCAFDFSSTVEMLISNQDRCSDGLFESLCCSDLSLSTGGAHEEMEAGVECSRNGVKKEKHKNAAKKCGLSKKVRI